MRPTVLALTVATAVLFAPAAIAAPTCQDINGGTIRCGTQGAMPVGWTLPFEQRLEQGWVSPVEPTQFLRVLCVLGIYFCLLAMLPDFEGWRDEERS